MTDVNKTLNTQQITDYYSVLYYDFVLILY